MQRSWMSFLEISAFWVGRMLWAMLGGSHPPDNRQQYGILLFRSSKLGDFVCATGAICYLKEAAGRRRVGLLTGFSRARSKVKTAFECPWVSLIHAFPAKDTVIAPLDRPLEIKSALERSGWIEQEHAIVILALSGEKPLNLWKKLLLLRLAGVRGFLIGDRIIYRQWAKSLRTGRLTHQARTPFAIAKLASRELNLDRTKISSPDYRISLSPDSRRWAAEWWTSKEVGITIRVVVFTGGMRSHKRWPLEKFGVVLEYLAQRGAEVALIGDDNDRRYVGERFAGLPRLRNTSGQLDLLKTSALIALADIYFGNDSGPAHIAAGLGLETIVLFSGIHHPGVWEPFGRSVHALRHETDCRGCLSELRCPRQTEECIHAIPVPIAIQALNHALTAIAQRKRIGS